MRSLRQIFGVLLLAGFATNLHAQRVRIPDAYRTAPDLAPLGTLPNSRVAPGLGRSPFAVPGGSPVLVPGQVAPALPGGATLNDIQPFDPYANAIAPSWAPPAGQPGLAPGQSFGPNTVMPPAGALPGINPGFNQPPPFVAPQPSRPPLNPGGIGDAGAFPEAAQAAPYGSIVPNQPLYPDSQAFATAPGFPYKRLFQNTGFRYTWLNGSGGSDLEIHEVEVSTTAYFDNFLQSRYALRVTPGFAFDMLHGPTFPWTNSDLPSQLYAAYLDFGWSPQITPYFAIDIGARVGVYSDFDTVTTDSIRVIGTGLGILRVTPNLSAKLGVAYIDRNRIKLLPAAGFLWQPNPQTYWDIFFPAPKLASYIGTNGNTEFWWYLAGEYGGGAWTIDREEDPAAGFSERIDINDIRVSLGIEWSNLNRYYAFIEAGYVFEREIVYVTHPDESVKLDDTFMLRAGFSF